MAKLDTRDDITVEEYITSINNEQMIKDARVLIDMMKRISGQEPILWGIGTIGFGMYHYKYESGREGDAHTISFYPRKDKITFYLMDGTARYANLIERLGKHNTTKVCLYIKRLSDIDLKILEQIIRESYNNVQSQDGQMQRAVS